MAKRLLCVLLSVLMVVAMLPTGVVAATSRSSITIDGTDYTVVADDDTGTSSGGWNSYFSGYGTYIAKEGAMIYIEYTCTTAPEWAAIKFQYKYTDPSSGTTTYDQAYDEHYFTSSIETGSDTYSYAVAASTIMYDSTNSTDYDYNCTAVQWGGNTTPGDLAITYVALLVPVTESDTVTIDGVTYNVAFEDTLADLTGWSTILTVTDAVYEALNTDGAIIEVEFSGGSWFWAELYVQETTVYTQESVASWNQSFAYVFDIAVSSTTLLSSEKFISAGSQIILNMGENIVATGVKVLVPATTSSTTPTLYGKTLTLDGSIGVTYYFDMGELDASDYTLKGTLSYDGNETAVAVSASSRTVTLDGTEYTRYTVPVTIATFLGTIDVDLVDSNGDVVVALDDYSASDYCTAKANDATVGDLCKALVTYAYYADVAINENSGTSITGYEDMSSYTGASSLTASTDTSGIEKTIVLGDTVYIRIYVDGTANTYTVSGRTVTSTSSYIEFPVAAKELASDITIYKDGEEYMTYSVYTYVANQLSSSSSASDAVKNLCKAVYYYGQAASSFTSWQ